MIRARWRYEVGPPSILLGIALAMIAVLSATSAAATPSAAADSGCPSTPSRAARAALGESDDRAADYARVEHQLTRRGELTGRVLKLQRSGAPELAVPLPAESFVGERVGDVIVYTRVAGGRSEVHLVDVVTGCDTRVATPDQIVRSAVLDASASAIYVHSVTGAGRRDAGVERHDLASGTVSRAVPPLATAELGLIFGTELRWSTDGSSLAVQSCGFAWCLTRIYEVATGLIATFDGSDQGALIGVSPAHLITFGACPGLPCAVRSVDRRTGSEEVLVEEAHGARLTPSQDGAALLSIQTAGGTIEVAR
jgi:hypothetical protein